jgi:hypothetical protein
MMAVINPKKIIREWLGIHDNAADPEFFVGTSPQAFRDRPRYNLQETIEDSLTAWRENPIARRIVSITTQYVIGKGIHFKAEQESDDRFLHQFWNHPLNRMDIRIHEWSDELCRSGNLFILLSSDPSGMSFVRAVPASQIQEIKSRDNDLEQPISFGILQPFSINQVPDSCSYGIRHFPAADRLDPTLEPAMLHFTVNRPVGAQWGEPDLSPLLRWISRYSNWLEDRARLNRYRNSFLFVVKARFGNEAQRLQRQQQLNAIPPAPGSILVTGEQEEWSVLSPQLESADANTDGLAMKKMIAAGAGIPLHFLAEPESENKTSAESAGESTYRHFEQRQKYFLWLISDLLQHTLARRAQIDPQINPDCSIQVTGDDISAADNLVLSEASSKIGELMLQLTDREMISDEEALRIIYRFMGENKSIKAIG